MAVTAQERTFDWFAHQTARFGLRVTLNGTTSRDPEDRGLALIDRSGQVIDTSGYARFIGGKRVWIETRDGSPLIDIYLLESTKVQKMVLNLDPTDGGFGEKDLLAMGLVATERRTRLDGEVRLYSQCLRCGAWATVRDEEGQPSLDTRHAHALCGTCRRAIARLNERLHDHSYGPVWRQCPRCQGWYRTRETAPWNEVCYGCRRRGGEIDDDEMEELLSR